MPRIYVGDYGATCSSIHTYICGNKYTMSAHCVKLVRNNYIKNEQLAFYTNVGSLYSLFLYGQDDKDLCWCAGFGNTAAHCITVLGSSVPNYFGLILIKLKKNIIYTEMDIFNSCLQFKQN